ncbi:TetR/AcrR family transcriptional regulator [Novipirellula sp.]|uniref:TetR/AcrR family transcriptional regulator n=1 Tax=Novipirellula sp. TaxID=2795430 RepID=UPI00356A321B
MEAALMVFLEKGYEGSTFNELVAAMDISPPSFYAAFENKEGLFRRAIEHYAKRGEPIVEQALRQPTAFEVIETFMRLLVELDTAPDKPPGCLFVQGALTSSEKSHDIRLELAARRTAIEPILTKRLKQARKDGDMSVKGNPKQVARYVATVLQGVAVQAASGSSRKELEEVIKVSLQGLMATRN